MFSLVTIENERVVIFESCDVTLCSLFSHFGAENRQLFARVCARSIAPSVVLSMICDCRETVNCLMQPSLCSVDGSCVCDIEFRGPTKLTHTSKDGIDSLNPRLTPLKASVGVET